MRHTLAFSILTVLAALAIARYWTPVSAAPLAADPAAQRIRLSIQAGRHDRLDAMVSVLIDAPGAPTALIEFPDGTLGRAQLVEPGMANAAARSPGKQELHFGVPKLAKGETLEAVAIVSTRPLEGRGYVWSGEPSQTRRLSCSPCHQNAAMPSAAELRLERKVLEETGKAPPFQLTKLLPTAKGRDFRWHESLNRFESSACWECHGRHMVEYEFGSQESVFHRVYRVKGDRPFSESGGETSTGPAARCGIHYGFQRATIDDQPVAGLLQQHRGTISEEAGKYIGRQVVSIDWTAAKQDAGAGSNARKAVAREERQVTVKNMGARNGSKSLWIDVASELRSLSGTIALEGDSPPEGFCFLPGIDRGTVPEFRQSAEWKALTFTFDGEPYTAVCFNHPSNPKPHADGNPTVGGIGYRFSATFDERQPLRVHYRLWIQGGTMSPEEIQSLSDDFREPVEVQVKPK